MCDNARNESSCTDSCIIVNLLKSGCPISQIRIALLVELLLCQLPTIAKDQFSDAVSLYNSKDFKAAASVFSKLTHTSKTPTSSYYLALCYQQLNAQQQALDLYKAICKQWPGTAEARLAEDYLGKLKISVSETVPANGEITQDDNFDGPPLTRAEWDALPSKTKIPFLKENGHLMVQAKINGKYCKVIFDTGAIYCGISKRDFPDVVPALELATGKRGFVSRPNGVAPVIECTAEISLQDITRTVKLLVIDEAKVSVIGQNFFGSIRIR